MHLGKKRNYRMMTQMAFSSWIDHMPRKPWWGCGEGSRNNRCRPTKYHFTEFNSFNSAYNSDENCRAKCVFMKTLKSKKGYKRFEQMNLLFFFFLAAPRSMRDFTSPLEIEPGPAAMEAGSPNHWTTRQVPNMLLERERLRIEKKIKFHPC